MRSKRVLLPSRHELSGRPQDAPAMDALTQSSESGYIVNHKQLERTMNRIFLTLLLVIITILMNITSARAVTLHWGSAVGDFIYESDGVTAVTDSAYEFELGTFTDGFTPSTENLADWANNWHTLDVGSYSSMNGYLAGSVRMLTYGSTTRTRRLIAR